MEWFAFQKFNSFRNFWKLSGKILYLFESFGWMYGKRPLSTDQVYLYSCHKLPTRKLFQGAFKTILYPEEAMNASQKSRLKENVRINHLFHFLFYCILFYFSQRYGCFKNSSVRLLHPQCFPGSNPFSLAFSIARYSKAFFFFFSLCPLNF